MSSLRKTQKSSICKNCQEVFLSKVLLNLHTVIDCARNCQKKNQNWKLKELREEDYVKEAKGNDKNQKTVEMRFNTSSESKIDKNRSSNDGASEELCYSDEYTEIDTETLFDKNGNTARQNERVIAAVNEELSKMIVFTETTTSDTEFCNEDVQNNNETLVQSEIDSGITRKAYSNKNIEKSGIEPVKHDHSNVSELQGLWDYGPCVRVIRRDKTEVEIGRTKNCCANKMALGKDLGMDNLKLAQGNHATRARSIESKAMPGLKECDVKITRISETDFRKMKNCCVMIKRLDKKFVTVLKYLDQDSMQQLSVQKLGGSGRSIKVVVLSHDTAREEICDIQENSKDNGSEELCDNQENSTFNFIPHSCNSNHLNMRRLKTSSSFHGISAVIDDPMECHELRGMVIGQNDIKNCETPMKEERHTFNCDVSTTVDSETEESLQNCSFSTEKFYSARSNASSSFTNETFDSAMDETPIQSHFVSSDEEDIEKHIELIPKIKIKRKLIQGILCKKKRKAIRNNDSISNTKVDCTLDIAIVSSSSVGHQLSPPGDTRSDKTVPQILTKRKSKQWRPYTMEEDDKIVEYMKENGMSGRQRGRRRWQVMEAENACPGRSWQSMKERWIKHIELKT